MARIVTAVPVDRWPPGNEALLAEIAKPDFERARAEELLRQRAAL